MAESAGAMPPEEDHSPMTDQNQYGQPQQPAPQKKPLLKRVWFIVPTVLVVLVVLVVLASAFSGEDALSLNGAMDRKLTDPGGVPHSQTSRNAAKGEWTATL
ncbi:hypothetical protein AALF15_12490 [Corynebacteriaceae bacterium 7-707]